MKTNENIDIPIGTQAAILSKLYIGVLSKKLERLDIERYFSILYFLNNNNGCKQQYICNNLAIDKTAMVKIIDYLIKSGLIDRNVNPEDRREHFIVLTKKGLRQTEEAVAAFNAIDEAMFAGISKDDQDKFLKVLGQMASNLKEMPFNELFVNYKKTNRKKRDLNSQF